jgi:hypothetical protein
MRKLVLITAAVVALGCTGLAIAHGLDGKSVVKVGASFTAAPSGTVQTSTCTGTDGSYTRSKGTYTGTISGATGDNNLNGPVTIDAESWINTTTNLGTVAGKIRFGTPPPPPHDEKGPGDIHFEAVYSGAGGNIAGIAEGHLGASHADLLANISGTFSTASGFSLHIGGTSGGDAVEVVDGGCKPTPPPAPPKPDKTHAEGTVTALTTTSPGSITVAGVTCSIPSNLLTEVAGLNLVVNSTRVEIDCTAGALTKIEAPGHGKVEGHGPKH